MAPLQPIPKDIPRPASFGKEDKDRYYFLADKFRTADWNLTSSEMGLFFGDKPAIVESLLAYGGCGTMFKVPDAFRTELKGRLGGILGLDPERLKILFAHCDKNANAAARCDDNDPLNPCEGGAQPSSPRGQTSERTTGCDDNDPLNPCSSGTTAPQPPATRPPAPRPAPGATAGTDPDRDGIKGNADKCPQVPEDLDGFEDTDGCPEPDNDRDGILDIRDKCPNKAENKNGFMDDDGCPDRNVPKTWAEGMDAFKRKKYRSALLKFRKYQGENKTARYEQIEFDVLYYAGMCSYHLSKRDAIYTQPAKDNLEEYLVYLKGKHGKEKMKDATIVALGQMGVDKKEIDQLMGRGGGIGTGKVMVLVETNKSEYRMKASDGKYSALPEEKGDTTVSTRERGDKRSTASTGPSPTAVETWVRNYLAGKVKGAYQSALGRNPSLRGRLVVTFEVAGNGAVKILKFGGGPYADEDLKSKLRPYIGRDLGRIDNPGKEACEIEIPFSLSAS